MSRLIYSTAVLLAVACPAIALAHGTSKSYADWVIDGSRAEVRVNFSPHDFGVEIQGLDADSDQKVTGPELSKKEKEVLTKVIEATKLEAANSKGQPLQPCVAERPRLATAGDPIEEVQISATFVCPELVGYLRLETHYLSTLGPPHVSVATITAGAITAQHIFTVEAPKFELELEPPSVGAALADHLGRGARSAAGAALLLGLGVLCFLAGIRGAAAIVGAFAAAFAIAVFAGGPHASYVVAIPVAAAGVECMIPKAVLWRRAAIAAFLGAALGLEGGVAAAVPMKIAFVLGAIGPALLVGGVAALLATYRTRVAERAIGAASIAASIALLFFALR